MIYKGRTPITGIYKTDERDGIHRAMLSVYKGIYLVWQLIRSCFGRGYWINNQPWVDSDGWKNNE